MEIDFSKVVGTMHDYSRQMGIYGLYSASLWNELPSDVTFVCVHVGSMIVFCLFVLV